MFQVKLTVTDIRSLSYQGRIALAGKYNDPEQWLYRDAYQKCYRIYDIITKDNAIGTSAKV